MSNYIVSDIAGGDTATPLNLAKRLEVIRKYLPSSGAKLLDCGCGAGTYVRKLREEFSVDASGIEYVPEKVWVAHQDPALRAVVHKGDIEQMSFPDSTFDVALLNEVLEHIPDERRALAEIHRVLKSGGTLIVFSPNRWFPFETHAVHWKGTKRNLPHYVPFVPYIPLSVGMIFFDYWARNYWQGELRQLCEGGGFQVVGTDFLWQTFENISGRQPWLIRVSRRWLRVVADGLERTPLLRRFGISQVLILRKV